MLADPYMSHLPCSVGGVTSISFPIRVRLLNPHTSSLLHLVLPLYTCATIGQSGKAQLDPADFFPPLDSVTAVGMLLGGTGRPVDSLWRDGLVYTMCHIML